MGSIRVWVCLSVLFVAEEGEGQRCAAQTERCNKARRHREGRPPPPHAASAEELAAHENFMKQLFDPIWKS